MSRPRKGRDYQVVSVRLEAEAVRAMDRLIATVYTTKTRSEVARMAVNKLLDETDPEWVEFKIRENLAVRDGLYTLKELIKAKGLRVSEELERKIAARKVAIQTKLSQGLHPGDNRVWLRNQGVSETEIERFVELLKA